MSRLFLGIVPLILMMGCEKTEYPSQGVLEFYLLEDFQSYDYMKIDENTAVLSDTALIKYDDIISYNTNTHSFRIKDSTIHYDPRDFSPLLRKAFAVTIDRDIIYTGYFWSGFLSAGCNWVVVDLVWADWKNELTVEVGYPGLIEGDFIPDRRNDGRILALLKRDHKLRD